MGIGLCKWQINCEKIVYKLINFTSFLGRIYWERDLKYFLQYLSHLMIGVITNVDDRDM